MVHWATAIHIFNNKAVYATRTLQKATMVLSKTVASFLSAREARVSTADLIDSLLYIL